MVDQASGVESPMCCQSAKSRSRFSSLRKALSPPVRSRNGDSRGRTLQNVSHLRHPLAYCFLVDSA